MYMIILKIIVIVKKCLSYCIHCTCNDRKPINFSGIYQNVYSFHTKLNMIKCSTSNLNKCINRDLA